MSLGPDKAVCLADLTAALRPIAPKIDEPAVQANIGALATALHTILTRDATVTITAAENPEWTAWFAAVGAGTFGPPPTVPLKGKLT